MSKKFYVINFFLILIVVYLSIENYERWIDPKPPEKGVVVSKSKPSAPPSPAPSRKKWEMPPPASFKMISEKNLFSQERKEFPVPVAPEVKEGKKAIPRLNLSLHGVAVGKDFRSAVVSNPAGRMEKGGRDTLTVKVGDKIGDYTIAKIVEDRITLEAPGDSYDVLLYDPSRPKKRITPVSPEKPPQAAAVPARPTPFIPPSPGIGQVTPAPPAPGSVQPPAGLPAGREVPGRTSLRQRIEQRRLQIEQRRLQQRGVQPGDKNADNEERD